MNNNPSGDYYDYTQTMQPERPWLQPYHQSLVYLTRSCTRGGDGEVAVVEGRVTLRVGKDEAVKICAGEVLDKP